MPKPKTTIESWIAPYGSTFEIVTNKDVKGLHCTTCDSPFWPSKQCQVVRHVNQKDHQLYAQEVPLPGLSHKATYLSRKLRKDFSWLHHPDGDTSKLGCSHCPASNFELATKSELENATKYAKQHGKGVNHSKNEREFKGINVDLEFRTKHIDNAVRQFPDEMVWITPAMAEADGTLEHANKLGCNRCKLVIQSKDPRKYVERAEKHLTTEYHKNQVANAAEEAENRSDADSDDLQRVEPFAVKWHEWRISDQEALQGYKAFLELPVSFEAVNTGGPKDYIIGKVGRAISSKILQTKGLKQHGDSK